MSDIRQSFVPNATHNNEILITGKKLNLDQLISKFEVLELSV
jgi:hypothetical protein